MLHCLKTIHLKVIINQKKKLEKAAARSCSQKILLKFTVKNICARVSVLMKRQTRDFQRYRNKTFAFCKIFKEICFTEHLQMAHSSTVHESKQMIYGLKLRWLWRLHKACIGGETAFNFT